MKKSVLIIFISDASLISCVKEKTCVCKDNTGFVFNREARSCWGKRGIDNFKKKCEAKSFQNIQNGVLISFSTCEIE